MDTAAWYTWFADNEAAGSSPSYERLARRVAVDADLLALVRQLPPAKRQPNLVFSAVRFLGGPTDDPDEFATFTIDRWTAIADMLAARATQTNEAARTGALLPILARVDGPIALVEAGASAGLCLYPDRYAIRYDGRPALCESPVEIDVRTAGAVPFPPHLPEVVARIGIDLNPLDVADPADLAWLDACVWPEHDTRRQRLHAAAALVATMPPLLVRGDVLDVDDVLGELPGDVTPVVVHSAVIGYLRPEHRQRFAAVLRRHPRALWISNEFPGIVGEPPIDLGPPPFATIAAHYVLAVNGAGVAVSDPHGGWVRWPDVVS